MYSQTIYSFNVKNILGNEVFTASDSKTSADHTTHINLQGLTNGVYTIQLNVGGDVISKKLIIQ